MVRSAIKYSKNHYNYTLVYNKKILKVRVTVNLKSGRGMDTKRRGGGGSVNVVLIDSELDCGNSTAPYLLLHLKKKPLSH